MNKEKLIDLVKASGQEVIDRAEELVGDGEMLTDFDIWLRFDEDRFPSIEVTKAYAVKNSFDVLAR